MTWGDWNNNNRNALDMYFVHAPLHGLKIMRDCVLACPIRLLQNDKKLLATWVTDESFKELRLKSICFVA